MKNLVFSLIIALAISSAGCNDNPASPENEPPPEQAEDVKEYMQSLPAWDTFSPPKPDVAPTATSDPVPQNEVTLDVEVVNEDGDVEVLPDVVYACQAQPFTLTDTPENIVIYSPDVDILWPGGLIQGKSHRDGLGSLLGLSIAERTPIEVSIPSLANNDNFRTVDSPSQAQVAQAIGSMIGGAEQSGLATPSSITFKMETYHSESQFALQAGISGNYLGFEGSATGSVNKNASKTTISAQFFQKMYEVVVAPPQTPDAFFSADFTQQKLQEQINLGRIGSDNLPVYVSSVVYGRMMMFSITSTASESDIRATLNAAYNGIGGSVEANLSVQQRSILQEADIRYSSLGGEADATLDMIRSGDWSQYFTNNAPLTSASPLSYTFRNLGDASIASVTETSEYNVTTCDQRVATPGTFDLKELLSLGLPISVPVTSHVADINGDDYDDIVWNHVSSEGNETVIGFSDGSGGFTLSPVFSHPGTPSDNWSNFTMAVGDFNNDEKDDLVWNRVTRENETFVTYSNGDGTFTTFDGWFRPESGWGTYTFRVGDFDGRNGDDLLWNFRGGDAAGTNRTYVSFNNDDGTFTANNLKFQDHPVTGWGAVPVQRFEIADVNTDGRDDILWYGASGISVAIWPAIAVGDTEGSVFSFQDPYSRTGNWSTYEPMVGDIDGVDGADFVIIGENSAPHSIQRAFSRGNGVFSSASNQTNPYAEEGPFSYQLLDVNGDGTDDLLMNHMGAYNRSFIGLGTSSTEFDFGRVSQDHPAVDDWSQFDILVGDFNGDGFEDVVYNNANAANDIYVALAKD